MPFRLSFIDRKGFEERRVTHPVPVKVKPDGTFEVPSLTTLPEGYVLQSTPCIMPKAVTLAGVDILAVHAKGTAPFGTAQFMGAGQQAAMAISNAAAWVSSVSAGGVKWNGCGSENSRGAK
jgi:hypothetical protein